MARKDDLRLLFNFLIDLLKEEDVIEPAIDDKELISEEVKKDNSSIGVIDASRIKDIMDKIEAKGHEDANVKQALTAQAKHYKKEIDELKEAFNKKVLKEDKLEIEDKTTKFSGDTTNNVFVGK
jgi:hypothetical protein